MMKIIATNITNDMKHCSQYFELLVEIIKIKKDAHPFIFQNRVQKTCPKMQKFNVEQMT